MVRIDIKVSRDFAENLIDALSLIGANEEVVSEKLDGRTLESALQFKQYLMDLCIQNNREIE